MRAAISIAIGLGTVILAGCVGFTGTSALKSPDQTIYAGYVETNPAVFVGPLPAMAYPMPYVVRDCFYPRATVKDVPGLIFGAHPLDVVCRQYKGVDLRKYPQATAECFTSDDSAALIQQPMFSFHPQKHPWLSSNPSAECVKLITDIQAARKAR